jgi:hypothetical protein
VASEHQCAATGGGSFGTQLRRTFHRLYLQPQLPHLLLKGGGFLAGCRRRCRQLPLGGPHVGGRSGQAGCGRGRRREGRHQLGSRGADALRQLSQLSAFGIGGSGDLLVQRHRRPCRRGGCGAQEARKAAKLAQRAAAGAVQAAQVEPHAGSGVQLAAEGGDERRALLLAAVVAGQAEVGGSPAEAKSGSGRRRQLLPCRFPPKPPKKP